MTVDRYTKAVLTVIAGCLLWICAMGTGQVLSAQSPQFFRIPNANVQPVVIVGTGTLDQQGTVTVSYIQQDGVRRDGSDAAGGVAVHSREAAAGGVALHGLEPDAGPADERFGCPDPRRRSAR